jgi:hypothetical protein
MASSACIFFAALFIAACSTSRCQPAAMGKAPLLEVQHLSGGDAPVAETLVLYDNGQLELNHAARRAKRPECATIPSQELATIRSLLSSPDFQRAVQALAGSGRQCCDKEEALVKYGGLEFWVVTNDAPAEVAQIFSALDRMALGAFGRHYWLRLALK